MYTKIAGHEINLNKLKIMEITQIMFSDHSGIKLKAQVNFLHSYCSFPYFSALCHPLCLACMGVPSQCGENAVPGKSME